MSKADILIVEDEAIVAEDLSRKLSRLGYGVVGTTASGEESLVLTRERRPDLVLMDIRLEGRMDGVAAAQVIRREYDLPVIYLTAHSDSATLQRAKLTEPFGYILKPFETSQLETQIQMALHKHHAEQEVRRQREWLRVTLQSIGDAVITTDAAGKVTSLNPVAEELTGWNSAEALHRPLGDIFNIINEETRKPALNPLERVLKEGKVVGLANHTVLVSRAGKETAIEDSAAPIKDALGRILGVVMVFHDVTEKRQAEERLRESEEKFRAFFETAAVGTAQMSLDGRFVEVNKRLCQMTGYSQEELLKVGPVELVHPDDRKLDAERLAAYLRNEKPTYESEIRYVRKDGQEVWVLVTAALVRDAEGKPLRSAGVIQDITERKRAEQALQASNKELESFNRAMIGRELRMIELKKEIDDLCVRFGEPPRYGRARNEKEQ